MSNKKLLLEVLELLREVREEVQGVAEDSVLHQIDEAILKLEETSHTRQSQIAYQEVLEMLGKVVRWIPAIAKLIELLGR